MGTRPVVLDAEHNAHGIPPFDTGVTNGSARISSNREDVGFKAGGPIVGERVTSAISLAAGPGVWCEPGNPFPAARRRLRYKEATPVAVLDFPTPR
ncbi:MAG: hypothetical protein AVDCRST_MAG87-2277 [uncultured Thermomicrobiales bacterium]|uniref:Uncharacterized protein n=1 Tax=uncultured Thermomicrobiales bacterium TaxID=1645740 RepID=A0A6J4VA02_9BACT|nr:MAG: hypothetical protein AVDCRST_MAG87-2277 [uncultured Thermomicrobiales bacterium]